ncbi:amidohydrolase [Ureibacillus aquaedulcis]|uniref:Amidohydrolase n=1 Tax=Ureibacillus aquaedulcis TaxID=3058421 RepID=A0ABT8GVX1_9BACL|nr:amidohydrolase [Ureibacillus sp. BA0131]MDN4495563.1 amidohydrolase [Ureibacillus sp. BA0131]
MGQIKTCEEVIYGWFDHFHAHPEISWAEVETTKKIASILDEMNINYKFLSDITGLVAEIGQGEEVIAVRADIDALWQEVDGTMRANHSCGHDANISMVLGALLQLKDEPLKKRIRFIFQPAEETGGGAIEMVKHGVIDDVSYLFGVHLRPIEELPLGKVTPAIHHGAALFLNGSIHGADAHGARPHQGKNAIDVIFAIQQMLKNIYINPFEVYSAKLTKIVADGGSTNIIPGNATFSMDVRAQKNSVIEELQSRIDEGLEAIRKMYGVELSWDWLDKTPGAEVSEDATRIANASIIEALGAEYLEKPLSTPGSDDFHHYTVLRPNLKAAMIGIGADLTPGLHHPKMNFKREALITGAKVLTTTLRNAAHVEK